MICPQCQKKMAKGPQVGIKTHGWICLNLSPYQGCGYRQPVTPENFKEWSGEED